MASPYLVANRIVDHAHHDLAAQAQGDRNAKMRDPVEIIHGAIQWIDDPLMIAGLIPHDTFLAVKRVGGKFVEKQLADQFLPLNIDLQLDVVRRDRVDALALLKIFAQQLTRCARGILGCIEITLHQKIEW